MKYRSEFFYKEKLYKARREYLELYDRLVEEMKKEKWWKRCLWIINKRYF